MTEVSETLMNVEQAIRRTQRAQTEVARIGYDGGAREALDVVLRELIKARDRLFQASYLVPVPPDEEHVEPEPTTLFPELVTPLERQQRLA
jgi:predicted esterase